MNRKTLKKLRRRAEQLALHTALAADLQGKTLRHPNTVKRIYKNLKHGKLA